MAGDAPPRTMSELAHVVASAWPQPRVLALTSAGTGLPALRGLDLAVLPTFRSLRYEVLSGLAPGGVALPTEQEQLDRLAGSDERYDVVLLDPFHSLESSRRGLAAALAAAAADSLVLVHDCRPPVHLRGEPFRPGPWCGVTDEAFVEACLDGDRDWLTVDTDFGVGILGPVGSRRRPTDEESAAESLWRRAATPADRAGVLDRVGPALLHLTAAGEVPTRLDVLLDAALGDRRLPGSRSCRSPVDELRAEEARLHAEAARLRGELALAGERARAATDHGARELAAARAETDAVCERVELMRRSPSMRVGRAVTAPVRLVRERGRRAPS